MRGRLVWPQHSKCGSTFHSAMAGTFQSDTGGTSIPLLSAHSAKVVIQSYEGIVNKMVWRKEI